MFSLYLFVQAVSSIMEGILLLTGDARNLLKMGQRLSDRVGE